MDDNTTLEQLKQRVGAFAIERDWEQFHNPRDLALHLAVEAAELLDHFRYKREEELQGVLERKREEISDELADVIILAFEFARMHGFDIATAVHEKLAKNERKYPIEKSKGVKGKYNEL
jgi:NTP pyrophosphatase (non-canonical NTP hydrolase)